MEYFDLPTVTELSLELLGESQVVRFRHRNDVGTLEPHGPSHWLVQIGGRMRGDVRLTGGVLSGNRGVGRNAAAVASGDSLAAVLEQIIA